MVKRFIAFIVTVLLVLSSAGCWSRREIEKLAMATMLTYDKVTVDGQEKWMVSGTFIIPGALAAEGPLIRLNTWVLVTKGQALDV